MGISNTMKNIGIGVVVLVVLTGAYIFLVGNKKIESPLLAKDSPSSNVSPQGNSQDVTINSSQLAEVRDIVSILNQLKTISIEDAVFKDPAFRTLTDFHRDISPQPKGRANPFLPGEGVRVTSGSQSGR